MYEQGPLPWQRPDQNEQIIIPGQAAGNILLLDYAHFASDPEKFAKKRAWLQKAISEEIRKKEIWKAPDSDRAHYYQENYPEIWTKTTKTLLTEEEPHVY